jgi:hypothetical protein
MVPLKDSCLNDIFHFSVFVHIIPYNLIQARVVAAPPSPVPHGAKKGYFSTFFRRWGRENALRAAIAQRSGWRRPIDVPGAGRGAPGRHGGARGRKDENPHFRYHSSLNQIVLD